MVSEALGEPALRSGVGQLGVDRGDLVGAAAGIRAQVVGGVVEGEVRPHRVALDLAGAGVQAVAGQQVERGLARQPLPEELEGLSLVGEDPRVLRRGVVVRDGGVEEGGRPGIRHDDLRRSRAEQARHGPELAQTACRS